MADNWQRLDAGEKRQQSEPGQRGCGPSDGNRRRRSAEGGGAGNPQEKEEIGPGFACAVHASAEKRLEQTEGLKSY
jgi:hypothetical protein